MKIEVLGSGCDRCRSLSRNASEAVADLGLDVTVAEVHDVAEIVRRGILTTPALVIDDEVVVAGRVPTVGRIRQMLGSRD